MVAAAGVSVATAAGSAAGAVSVVVVSAGLASVAFSPVFFDFLEKSFLNLALSYYDVSVLRAWRIQDLGKLTSEIALGAGTYYVSNNQTEMLQGGKCLNRPLNDV